MKEPVAVLGQTSCWEIKHDAKGPPRNVSILPKMIFSGISNGLHKEVCESSLRAKSGRVWVRANSSGLSASAMSRCLSNVPTIFVSRSRSSNLLSAVLRFRRRVLTTKVCEKARFLSTRMLKRRGPRWTRRSGRRYFFIVSNSNHMLLGWLAKLMRDERWEIVVERDFSATIRSTIIILSKRRRRLNF